MGFFKKQFIDIIEWIDNTDNTILYMFPVEDREIQNGAQLVVRPGQVAVFIDKGQIADVFGPGTYKLTTENLPLLTDLKHWNYGFKSPFKADVCFINMKDFTGNKWGTTSPIWIEDTKYGQVQVRAYGTFGMRVENPVAFINNIAGVKPRYFVEDILPSVKSVVVNQFTEAIAQTNLTVTQLATTYNKLGDQLVGKISEPIETTGISLTRFTIENINVPEAVEKEMQKVTNMNIMASASDESFNKYKQVKEIEIMEKAAGTPNSSAGAGISAAMGMKMFNDMVNEAKNTAQPQQSTGAVCNNCHHTIPAGAKFCPECGAKQEKAKEGFCVECGAKVPAGAKFCPECGHKMRD